MAKKLTYERYYWLHGQAKAMLYPNAKKLSEMFEISQKQAQRDIEFLRERLDAPLVYNADKRGYEYEHPDYELPPVWFKEDELLAFCLALRLASTLPDKLLKDSLYHFLEKILSYRSLDTKIGMADFQKKVSVKNIQYYRVNEDIFHRTVIFLIKGIPIRILYYSPFKSETTERTIQPLHLLNYMGNWHLIAYCTLRKDLRDFSLSRIQKIKSVSEAITLPNSAHSVQEYIGRNFGLLSGGDSIEICLKFAPEISDWVSEQIWHTGQSISADEDNAVWLRFPVADFREIRREILKFGAQIEVVSPESLRQEIKDEISKMHAIYM